MVTHQTIDKILSTLVSEQGSNTMLGRMGKKYDAFKVLISTILSARAKDEVTEIVADKLFDKYPTPRALATAKKSDVITIIRKIGFYNAKATNIIETSKIILQDFGGNVPDTLEELISLPGVGRKVANCVLVYSFKKDAIPVDIHVHRISNRLGWIETTTPEQSEHALMDLVPKKHWQALNDTFVTHGKTTCTPISPKCSECPVRKWCKQVGVTSKR